MNKNLSTHFRKKGNKRKRRRKLKKSIWCLQSTHASIISRAAKERTWGNLEFFSCQKLSVFVGTLFSASLYCVGVNNAKMGVIINTKKTTWLERLKHWIWNTSYNLPSVFLKFMVVQSESKFKTSKLGTFNTI